jgi:hypothetical protein
MESEFLAVTAVAFVVEVLIEHFIGAPLEEQAPQVPRFWLRYVALAAGAGASYFSGLNLFPDMVDPLVGQIMTAGVAGGGMEVVHAVMEFARNS